MTENLVQYIASICAGLTVGTVVLEFLILMAMFGTILIRIDPLTGELEGDKKAKRITIILLFSLVLAFIFVGFIWAIIPSTSLTSMDNGYPEIRGFIEIWLQD